MAHQDANIIFGTVIDDEMGDEIKVTVIAAGFDRWDGGEPAAPVAAAAPVREEPAKAITDLFGDDGFGDDDDDDFDVPSFLK
ncbi:MAG: hypothetical protein R2705_04040 [Ilumatobacteraceae bacterium]